jgi:hypothetical protein
MSVLGQEQIDGEVFAKFTGPAWKATWWTIPDGEIWVMTRFIGNALYHEGSWARLIWDYPNGPIIAVTTGDADIPLDYEMEGDGDKELAVQIWSESAAITWMQARWRGVKL